MNCTLEIVIDERAKVPRIVIYTAELSDEVRQLSEQLKGRNEKRILGYREEELECMYPKQT